MVINNPTAANSGLFAVIHNHLLSNSQALYRYNTRLIPIGLNSTVVAVPHEEITERIPLSACKIACVLSESCQGM